MSIIGFLIIGLLAGALARLLVPGRDPMGLIATLLLGLAGSFLGGFLAKALFDDNDGVGLVGSVIGAIILLLIYNAVTRRRGVNA
ncbi:MAG: GlsB/YeaQ/YmgE family stress response membrane protein [Actinomycetota bacterium]|nr:GlsB/YeaQ/YmgE family stress response membrane protein [Actinomycetota bacterium]